MTERGTTEQQPQQRGHVTGLDPFTVPVATHPLAMAPVRARVVVAGTVGPVRTVAWAGGPVTEVSLVDDTDVITLAFFGDRGVAGVHTGSRLAAAGTVVDHHGRRMIMSPQLWLTPPPLPAPEPMDLTPTPATTASVAMVPGLTAAV
jgi:hypothetical protein